MPNPISLFRGVMQQKTAPYGIPDLTPPVFAGVTTVTPNTDGSITVEWALATSPKTPVDYHVYIVPGSVSAATLFNPVNVALHVPAGKTKGRIFLLSDEETYLINGQQYTIGVRANDAYSIEDGNVVIQVVTAIASGNFPAIFQTYLTNLATENTAYGTFNTAHSGLNTTHATNNSNQTTNNTNQAGLNTALGTTATSLGTSSTSVAASATSLGTSSTSVAASATSLGTSATSIGASSSTLSSSAISVAASATSLGTSSTSVAASATALAAISGGLTAVTTSLSASAGTQMSFLVSETVMTIESDGV